MNVCFLPGALCDGRVFGPQIAAVTKAAHYCTVLDLRSESTIEAMAQTVLASTSPGVVLVGISLGSIVAAEVVAQAPEHASAIALFDTNLDAPDDRQLRTRAEWARQVRTGSFAQMVAHDLTASMTSLPHRNNELIFDMAMQTTASGFLNQNDALLHRRDRRNDLAGFDRPVLIVSGADDHVCPPSVHADLAARIPHATQHVVQGAGHLSTIDQPEELNTVLVDWLQICINQISTQEGPHEYEHA